METSKVWSKLFTIILVLFFVITLMVVTYIATDRGTSLNINKKAALISIPAVTPNSNRSVKKNSFDNKEVEYNINIGRVTPSPTSFSMYAYDLVKSLTNPKLSSPTSYPTQMPYGGGYEYFIASQTPTATVAPVVTDSPVVTPSPVVTTAPTQQPYKQGDANFDGYVNETDYLYFWLPNYLTSNNCGVSCGDFNGDGETDELDYIIWLLNYDG